MVLLCGPLAHAQHDQNGTWCFDKVDSMTITPLMAFRELAKQGEIRLIEQTGKHWSREVSPSNIASLTRLARQADVVLYFGGEESILSGEARCRAHLNLPGDQSAQLRALKATGKPVVLTVMAGRPLCIGDDIAAVDACLYAFHGGTMQGPALANLIMGKVAPSGRLPITFPNAEGQIPLYYNKKNTGRPTDHPMLIDDIPVGAGQFSIGESSYWLEYGDQPLYPFGYGLSYTKFQIDFDGAEQTDDNVTVKCTVKNISEYAGKEVVQVYFSDRIATVSRPLKELVAFKKTKLLEPDEEVTVKVSVAGANNSALKKQCETQGKKAAIKKYLVKTGNTKITDKVIDEAMSSYAKFIEDIEADCFIILLQSRNLMGLTSVYICPVPRHILNIS